jgi:hypothetical protein
MEALIFIPFVALAVLCFVWHISRSRSMLDDWARAGGLQLLSSERRYLRTGPFFFRHAKGQEIFYVTVRTPTGEIRRAYVRCGGWFLGLLSDAVTVEWDD